MTSDSKFSSKDEIENNSSNSMNSDDSNKLSSEFSYSSNKNDAEIEDIQEIEIKEEIEEIEARKKRKAEELEKESLEHHFSKIKNRKNTLRNAQILGFVYCFKPVLYKVIYNIQNDYDVTSIELDLEQYLIIGISLFFFMVWLFGRKSKYGYIFLSVISVIFVYELANNIQLLSVSGFNIMSFAIFWLVFSGIKAQSSLEYVYSIFPKLRDLYHNYKQN